MSNLKQMNIGGQIVPVVVNGIVDVEGMKFHDIEGGFGEGKKAILVKEIAEIHGRELRVINQNIERNRLRFKDGIDILDLKGTEFEITLSDHGIYNQNSINRSEKIYMLSERGYAKLLKILEDDVAWEQYEKLVDGYFNMRGQTLNTSELSPELQMFKQIFDTVAKQQLENKQMKEEIKETKEEIQGIRDVVSINTSAMNWREDCRKLIVKIARRLGGNGFITYVNREIYGLMRVRLKCKLDVQLTNMRRRMADEGVCKSKRDKLNYLDVIARDSRLIEGYVAIVKELAIKYGV